MTNDTLITLISIRQDSLKPKRPFKFVNAVADMPEFLPMVSDFWRSTEPLFNSTSALFRFGKKLKALKPLIRNLSKETIGDIIKRTKEAYIKLCELQTNTLNDPSQVNMARESEALTRWTFLSKLEEKVLSQRAKIHWLVIGDGNNKTFHRAAQVREIRNSIREIKREDGTFADNQEDIKEEAVNYFSKFLNHTPPDFTGISTEKLQDILHYDCSEENMAMLVGEVTADQIKKVLFGMAAEKSPGPDGYSSEFFRSTWAITGGDFVQAVQSFFDKGFLPKGINSTILALIPKKTDAIYMKDYRPISCCNVIYKVISKILASRLKRLLPTFVSTNQSAFVKDRLLMENVLLASELVKSYHKSSVSARCAVKIDISKAFDSVQWPFLISVLEAMSLPGKFILWIKRCIELASFSVQINGELAGYFNSKRGLRQGCSLSPFLFVICMQVLTKLLDRAAREGRLGYHPYCKDLSLTHLCFADDVIVFSDGKKKSIEGILEVFQEFAKISGLNISLEKSTLFLAGVKEDDSANILDQFPFEAGSLPVRYLGLPLLSKKMSADDYSPLISRIKNKISSWTARHLSFAGRLQLIGSVLYSITHFWMSAFRLPKQCIQEINSLCSAFLWSGPVLSTQKAKKAWSDVCKPKEEGGLGLRSLEETNNVYCLKLIWRILSARSSLWVQWIHRYLIRKGSFWSVKESSSLGSWMWKKLLKFRARAMELAQVEVANGSVASFWFDRWSPLGVLISLTGEGGCLRLGIPIHSTVEYAVQVYRKRRHRTHVLLQIEQEIMNLQAQGLGHHDDTYLWMRENGEFRPDFLSSHTWNLTRRQAPRVPWFKAIWFKEATPKYSFLSWLAAHDRLSTGDKLLRWNPQATATCWLCSGTLETRDHLFFECSFSAEIWRGLIRGLVGVGSSVSWSTLLQRLVSGSSDRLSTFLIRYCFQAAVYTIWYERNKRRVGEAPQSAARLLLFLDKLVRNRISSLRSIGGNKYEKAMELWFGSR